MYMLLSFGALFSLLVGIAGLIATIFLKGKRRFGAGMVVASIVAMAAIAPAAKHEQDARARSFGYSDYDTWQQAVRDERAAEEASRKAAEELAEAARRQAETDACRADLTCWGERAWAVASVSCPRQIERLAQYDFEWVDGLLGAKFSRYRRGDGEGVITAIGDQIRFQNGFGAWQRYIYECDVDPEREIVLAVRVTPGRLD